MRKEVRTIRSRIKRYRNSYEKISGKKIRKKIENDDFPTARKREDDARKERQEMVDNIISIVPHNREGYDRGAQGIMRNQSIPEIKPILKKLMEEVDLLLSEYERVSGEDREKISRSVSRNNINQIQQHIDNAKRNRARDLAVAGIPQHIASLMAEHVISDEDGIGLLRYLRQGEPSGKLRKNDILMMIDEMAFTAAISREDAKFLVENREHVTLVRSISEGNHDVDYARWLLDEKGFSGHPMASTRVVNGADIDRVAMVEGIESAKPVSEESSETEEEESESDATGAPARPTYRRRRGRFGGD